MIVVISVKRSGDKISIFDIVDSTGKSYASLISEFHRILTKNSFSISNSQNDLAFWMKKSSLTTITSHIIFTIQTIDNQDKDILSHG